MVPKDEMDMDSFNKISCLNKNPFLDLFHLFHDGNTGMMISVEGAAQIKNAEFFSRY